VEEQNNIAVSLNEQVNSILQEAYTCRINNLKKSITLANEGLEISREIQDKNLIAKCLNQLSLYYMISGEYDVSITYAEEAIVHFKDIHDEKGIADARFNIAGVYYKTDNHHLGLVHLIDCTHTYEKLNDFHSLAKALKSVGTIYEYFGDQNKALQVYEQAIDASKKSGDLNLKTNVYNPLSGIYLKQGKIKEADELIERSISIKQKTGDIRGLAFALYGRGKIRLVQQNFEAAEKDFIDALKIHQESGEKLGIGMTYNKLGLLYVEMNETVKAKDILYTGIEFASTYNMTIITFKCQYQLYRVYKYENNPIMALKHLELYLNQREHVINSQTLQVIENYELITKMESLEKEARVQKEKAEIIEKKDRAEKMAKVKTEFLSTMSHEIRTPLNAITTIATLLHETNRDQEEKKLLKSLKFASNNLLMLINDILDFTKLETGKVKLNLQPVVLNHLIGNIKNTYENLASEKGLIMSLKSDLDLSEVYNLDETKLSQILGNLLSNSIKYTEFGEINLEILKLESQQNKDKIRFSISDTGIGIPENKKEEIFDSFTQPTSITTRKQGGSGLGLAIVKKLVALHESEIEVKSVEGIGSVFWFDLLLEIGNKKDRNNEENTEKLKNKNVLLAEDNLINAMVASKLLSNWGIQTMHVKNGLEAIEKSKELTFDFILMDIHMPEMNGFDATAFIRTKNNLNKSTPIFALTADITAEFEEGYMNYFNGILRKPLEIEKLYEALVNA